MTETKNPQHESALPAKRKADLVSQDHDHQQILPNKSLKLQTLDETVSPNEQNRALDNDSSFPQSLPDNEDPVIESEEDEEEKEEDDDYDDDDDDGSAPVDRKGKGIMIEEVNDSDDEDDDDDSTDGGDESEDESDLSDDPLAEVDLDNILPSRTRRRGAHPGVRMPKDSDGSDS